LLAAHTELARLAALANLNIGTAACIKNQTGQVRYCEMAGTFKTSLAKPRRPTLPPKPWLFTG